MRDLLRRGIDNAFEEGEPDFQRYLEERGLSRSDAGTARKALDQTVDLLIAFNRATNDEKVPLAARVLFPAAVSYFFTEQDLLPSRPGQLILGLLDDVYFVMRAAAEVSGPIGLDAAGLDEHLAFLQRVLPEDVRREVDEMVETLIASATNHAEQLGV